MSPCSSALPVIFLLCLLRVHGNDWIQAQSSPSLFGFELPEIDGSPVEDTCKVFDKEPNTNPTTSTAKPTTRPLTKKQVIITKKPVVQSLPRKPVIKVPIRTRPTARGPITNHKTNHALRLLYDLLANSRGRLAGSQPMGGMSSSEESAAVWKVGAAASEDSSDES